MMCEYCSYVFKNGDDVTVFDGGSNGNFKFCSDKCLKEWVNNATDYDIYKGVE